MHVQMSSFMESQSLKSPKVQAMTSHSAPTHCGRKVPEAAPAVLVLQQAMEVRVLRDGPPHAHRGQHSPVVDMAVIRANSEGVNAETPEQAKGANLSQLQSLFLQLQTLDPLTSASPVGLSL